MKIKKLYLLISICFIVGLSLSLFLFKDNRVEAACFGCLADGIGNCSLDTSDCTLGFCSTDTYCMVNPFEGDPMVYSITTDPCIDGIKECKSNNCSGLTASDGDPCRVTAGVGGFHGLGGCAANPVNTGTWSSNRCILCAGIGTESGIYGDAAGIYAGGGIAGDMLCEANGCGASPECDEQAPTWVNPDGSGSCSASCIWTPTVGLILTISADPTAIDTTSTSDIDFLVEDSDGNPVSGVTVTVTAVTEAAGTVMVGSSCITNLAGVCPGGLTYGSGLSVGLKTITAEADDGVSPVVSSTVDVIVGDVNFECDVTGTKWFDPISFNIGLCSSLNGDSCGAGEYENCGPCHESNCPDGTFSSCFSKYQVCGCDCVVAAGPPPCIPNVTCTTSACAETSPTSAEFTETCIDAAIPQCIADTTTTSDCCLNDDHCSAGTPVCDLGAEQCVQCITSDDCAGTNVCNNYFCIPCTEDGEVPPDDNEDLCCLGLGYWDMNGDEISECTSACDPNAWFFCNPLRGSVETIVQAGETLLGYILGLIGSIALLFIIIAGMMYMTSAGNEERISSSKKILNGAVIGLMIALLAYGLLHVIMTVLGM